MSNYMMLYKYGRFMHTFFGVFLFEYFFFLPEVCLDIWITTQLISIAYNPISSNFASTWLVLMHHSTEYSPAKSFKTICVVKNSWGIINTIAAIWCKTILKYLSLKIICSAKLTVFLELCSRKTVHFSKQILYADKYPSIFLHQLKAVVYMFNHAHAWNISTNFKAGFH